MCTVFAQYTLHVSAQFHLSRTWFQSSDVSFATTLGFKMVASPVNVASGFYPALPFSFSPGIVTLSLFHLRDPFIHTGLSI